MFVYVCFRDGCTCRERRGGERGEGKGRGTGGGGKGSGVGILCRMDLYVYDVFVCLVFLSRRDVGVHVERGEGGKGRRGEGEESRRRGR